MFRLRSAYTRRNCSGFGRRGKFGPKQRNHNQRKQLSPLLPSDRSPNPFMEIVKHHLCEHLSHSNGPSWTLLKTW